MKKFRAIFLLIPAVFFTWIAANSTRFAGGEDGVMHHLFARYVPQHPANLLDHWAKPLYVLLSTPFAQFGFFGSLLFNILLATASGWLVWRSAENLKLRFPWMAAVFMFTGSIYFYSVSSSVTEILFGFLLIWAIYFATQKKYLLTAILISFLPFVRSEGNGVILIFALGLIALRAWKALPFLAFGTVIYSIAGYFYFEDIFWIWNLHPYVDASAIYGHGEFLYYMKQVKPIWGIPLYLLWIAGTLVFIAQIGKYVQNRIIPDDRFWIWFFMIFGSYFTYLVGHTLVWYLGKSASLGLIRVMAAVMPVCALIGLYAFDALLSRFNPKLKMIQSGLVLIMIFVMVNSAFEINTPPFHGDLEREQILKAGEWFRSSEYFDNKSRVFYFAPSVAEAFQIDPFNPAERGDLSEILWKRDIPSGSIIVWDAHFGPNECHLPIDTLMQRPELELIYHQIPEEKISTLNSYDYEIYLFRKP